MASINPHLSKRAPDGGLSSLQRKVRKGTQSCWECKRRKVRCSFPDSQSAICEPCARRSTLCVRQELPDPGRTSQVDDRISRVEAMLEEVHRQLPSQDAVTNESTRQVRETEPRHQPSFLDIVLAQDVSNSTASLSTPSESHPELEVGMSSNNDQGRSEPSKSLLASMIPSNADIETISRETFETPSCLYDLPCVQPFKNRQTSLGELAQLPRDRSHPTTLAKQSLLLASYLQNLSQGAVERFSHLGLDQDAIATRTVQAVRRQVLSNDNLVRSIDGIECLAIESMFYNNAGCLRDAWSTLRRAISIGQLLGIDRKAARLIQRANREESKEESIWFHLLSSDRYLSLMLNLPQAVPNANEFAHPEALAPFSPVQRLQRIHCLAGGIMLRHAGSQDGNTAWTEEVDVLLREAAENVESQWWLMPDFFNRAQPVPPEETLRLMIQFTHFNILGRLHQPWILRAPADGSFDHHKLTATNCSREILQRYVSLRTSNLTNNYCRGVDFLMFIAATTLCIAHINSSHWRQHGSGSSQYDFLRHQRPSDRGLMERALDAVQKPTRANADDIDSRISVVLNHLLASEKKAAAGTTFTMSTSADDDVSMAGGEQEDGKTLKIIVPFFGVIRIGETQVTAERSSGPFLGGQTERSASTTLEAGPNAVQTQGLRPGDSLLQGVDVALFNDLLRDWNLDAFTL